MLNTDMIEIVARLVLEFSQHETDFVLSDRCRHKCGNPAVTRHLTPGMVHRRGPIESSTAKEASSKPPDSRNSSQSPHATI